MPVTRKGSRRADPLGAGADGKSGYPGDLLSVMVATPIMPKGRKHGAFARFSFCQHPTDGTLGLPGSLAALTASCAAVSRKNVARQARALSSNVVQKLIDGCAKLASVAR